MGLPALMGRNYLMKRITVLIALSITAMFIVLAQTGCGDKANAANDNGGIKKEVNGGKNPKEGGVTTILKPQ
jgi:hypothetical protein